jgi:arylsulfatase A-like enzyme
VAPRGGWGQGPPFCYDRPGPGFFWGRGGAAARDSTRAATVDVAPTLAHLLGVTAPADLDGKVLEVGGR